MGESLDSLGAELEEEQRREVELLLAMAGSLEAEVDGLEAVGADFAVRGAQDPEGVGSLARILAREEHPTAATLLEATRFFAGAEVARRIDAALDEEGAVEAAPSLPGSFGDLGVPRALRFRSEVADNYLVFIERMGYEDEPRLAQLTVLTLDQGPAGGPLIAGELSPPLEAEGAEAEVRRLIAESDLEFEEIGAADVREALGAAIAENRRQEWPVEFGLGVALPILAVALGGGPEAFGEVPVREPESSSEPDDLDDSEFLDFAQAKLGEFMAWLDETGTGGEPVARCGHYVAGSMLEWKWSEGDSALSHWTESDLGDFLLDYVPRQVTTDDDVELAAPDCAAAYLTFLNERGELSGDSLRDLTEASRDLHDDFLDAAADRARWGPAKAMGMQMRADGVDASDPEGVQAWMEDFNARPFEERDRIVGPSLDARLPAAKQARRRSRH